MFLKISQLFILPMHTAAGAHTCTCVGAYSLPLQYAYVFAYAVVKTRLPYSFLSHSVLILIKLLCTSLFSTPLLVSLLMVHIILHYGHLHNLMVLENLSI